MEENSDIRQVFCHRCRDFTINNVQCNPHRSVVFEIVYAAKRLGPFNVLIGMMEGGITVVSKKQW